MDFQNLTLAGLAGRRSKGRLAWRLTLRGLLAQAEVEALAALSPPLAAWLAEEEPQPLRLGLDLGPARVTLGAGPEEAVQLDAAVGGEVRAMGGPGGIVAELRLRLECTAVGGSLPEWGEVLGVAMLVTVEPVT